MVQQYLCTTAAPKRSVDQLAGLRQFKAHISESKRQGATVIGQSESVLCQSLVSSPQELNIFSDEKRIHSLLTYLSEVADGGGLAGVGRCEQAPTTTINFSLLCAVLYVHAHFRDFTPLLRIAIAAHMQVPITTIYAA